LLQCFSNIAKLLKNNAQATYCNVLATSPADVISTSYHSNVRATFKQHRQKGEITASYLSNVRATFKQHSQMVQKKSFKKCHKKISLWHYDEDLFILMGNWDR